MIIENRKHIAIEHILKWSEMKMLPVHGQRDNFNQKRKNDCNFMTNKKNTSRSVETFSIFAVVFYEVELSIRFEVVDD